MVDLVDVHMMGLMGDQANAGRIGVVVDWVVLFGLCWLPRLDSSSKPYILCLALLVFVYGNGETEDLVEYNLRKGRLKNVK